MKKVIAAVGVALGGAALVLTSQGSAQASATPVAPVETVSAQDSGKGPEAIGGLGKLAGKAGKAVGKAAGKAYVHAKAACPSVANAALEAAGNVGSVRSANVPDAASVETVFDK
ncbi:hypothetical protein [Streptomyces syringium]|uniref:hypothetical protein n=1 Tax=Streptomyces syringium TaxID=76729 RepID=UPI0033D1E3EA